MNGRLIASRRVAAGPILEITPIVPVHAHPRRITLIDRIFAGVVIRLSRLIHQRIDAQKLPGCRVVVAVDCAFGCVQESARLESGP